MRAPVLFAVWSLYFAITLTGAEEKPLAGGRSPNSAYELILVPDSADSRQYQVGIRATVSQKVLFSTPIGGYAPFKMATEPFNLKFLWSPDSTFVAVASRGTKRSGETGIYHIIGDTVRVISVPDLARIIRPQLEADILAFFVRPEVWLPEYELAVSITGTEKREENGEYRFVAVLAVSRDGSSATVKSLQRDRTIDR